MPSAGLNNATVTYERRERLSWRLPEFRSLLRYERPNGLLAIDRRKNLRHEKAEVSNSINLVGVTGFEPATSSSRTPRSSRMKPYCAGPACIVRVDCGFCDGWRGLRP